MLTSWGIPGSSDFIKWVNGAFTPTKTALLFSHQQLVVDYMHTNSPYRGLLLYHGLGVGKTRSAIVIAEKSSHQDIVVLLPASLEVNFVQEMEKIKTRKNYIFIGYDGLKKKNMKEMDKDMFNEKLIIIDEVHTFISRAVGKGEVCKDVYQRLMDSTGSRFVALSGTPVINNPIEIAYTMNLISGYLFTYIFKLVNLPKDKDKLIESLDDCAHVSHYKMAPDYSSASVSFFPKGFKMRDKLLVKSNKDASVEVTGIFTKHNITVVSVAKSKTTLFPYNADEFETLFLDYQNAVSKNNSMFSRRIQGLVSYFESYDPKEYPRQNPAQIVKIPMEHKQFAKYVEARAREIAIETKNLKFKKDDNSKDMNKGNVYRAFSRAICNYVFPKDIARPYPSTMKQFQYDADEEEGDYFEDDVKDANKKSKNESQDNMVLYNRKIAKALAELDSKGDQYLSASGLVECGPKFAKIIENINLSPGTCLVYSSFRFVEGVKILSMAMNYDGYVELQVKNVKGKGWVLKCKDFSKPKYIVFTSKKDETKILMGVFNSDFTTLPQELQEQLENLNVNTNLRGEFVKVLMITKSGAQGISLKNVRQVHIMEPYWNQSLIKQVAGRAIRAKSHLALDKREQVVDTFMYTMTFVHKEHLDNVLLKANDMSKTADEYILDLAARKENINDQFLSLVRNAAFDCSFHSAVHKNTKCFIVPKGQDVILDIKEEKADKDVKLKIVKRTKEFKRFRLNSEKKDYLYQINPTKVEEKKYAKIGSEGDGWHGLFDPDDLKLVGVVQIIDGKMKKIKKC
jgi:superfamily II DNA or RNA helicase